LANRIAGAKTIAMSTDQPKAAPRALFMAYLLLLFWLPLPLGNNRPMAWAVVLLWVFALSIGWLIAYWRGNVHLRSVVRGAWPALLCFAAWLAYVWLQLLPLPVFLLELISPEAAQAHIVAAKPSSLSFAPLSLDLYGGLHGALKSSAYVLFFVLTLVLLDSHKRIEWSAYTLVFAGFVQTLYGGISALNDTAGMVAHGTFVNRNHFAGYLELCLAVGIGMVIANLTGDAAQTWKQFFRNTLALLLGPTMRLRLALVCMVIGLVLSRSRMGNTAFFVSLLVAGAIGLVLSKRATRSMVVVIVSLIVIDIAIVGTYFGMERVVERIEQTQMEDERQESVQAVGVWKDFPVFGSGLGSFHIVFPKYSGEGLGVLFTHAHNDYVQFLVETGVIGFSLLGLVVAMSLFAALRAQFLRGDPLMRGLSFGAIMGIVSLMIHSWVDFNLQIPSNAMTFIYVLGLAWISLLYGRQRQSA
jgi:putative inorganic carbon (HCO3(-)) transporter